MTVLLHSAILFLCDIIYVSLCVCVCVCVSFGNAYDGSVAWKGLRELLQGEGEQMSAADLDTFLVALVSAMHSLTLY